MAQTERKVPEITLSIVGEREGRFGYEVYATYEEKRDYVLACFTRKIEVGKDKGKYLIFEEIRNISGEILWKSRRKGIAENIEIAGSFCYDFAKNALGDRLAYHLLGEKDLGEFLREKTRGSNCLDL